jgi:cytochrome c biogenesis protein CcdA/thiol-disulfide isomerase/thioredoxin
VKAIWAAGFCVLVLQASPGHAQTRPAPADLNAVVETDGAYPGVDVRLALQVRLPERLHANANKPRDPSLIPMTLTFQPPDGITVEELVFPPPTDLEQKGAAEPLAVFEREFAIGVRLAVAASVPEGEMTIPARLRYQACDESMCYFPQTIDTGWTLRIVAPGATLARRHADVFATIPFGRGERPSAPAATPPPRAAAAASADDAGVLDRLDTFRLVATTAGYMGTGDFLQFIRDAESGVTRKGWFEGRGAVAILLIVLVGGLALNLTPCVLPMIPINLAIIGAGAQSGSRSRGFLLGATYGAAMALVYGVLGLVVILTAGTFGTINASPWFNLGIAVLFVALALAMFDVIAIDFSRFSSRFGPEGGTRGSLALAFTMGGVAALLAGACVAPVVIQVVLFSSNLYATGTTAALVLPFLLGVGMAIPWPIAGAGIAALPRPGAWMVRIKQAFGVVILATAAYYGYLAYGIFADRWVDAADVSASVEEKLKAGWHSSLAAGLAAAEREGKPVLVDVWATWCKNCLVMDRTTLADPAVTAALSNYVKVKFQAEDPDASPTKEVFKRLEGVGLPTYTILKPISSAQ